MKRILCSLPVMIICLYSCNRESFSEVSLPSVSVRDIDTSSFSLYWNRVNDTRSYILSIAKDPDFQRILPGYEYKSLKLDAHRVAGLYPYSVYYCRLKVNTFYGVSDYTPTLQVRTAPIQPPINVILTTHNSVEFSWSKDEFPGAYYQVDVSTTTDFSNIIQSFDKIPAQDTTLTVKSLQSHEAYYARLRSVRGTIYTYYAKREFRTRLEIPIPSLTSILDDAFAVSWNTVPRARSYTLQVSTAVDDFSRNNLKFEAKNIYSDKYTVQGLDRDKTYYYRLLSASNYSNASSLYSTPKKVITGSNILVQKFNFSSIYAVTPISFALSWNALSSVNYYTLDIATTPKFDPGTVLKNYQSKRVEGSFTYVENLSAGFTYYCRIQGHSDLGSSLYSDIAEVITIPLAPTLSPQQKIHQTKVELSWNAVKGAVEYFVDVASDENFLNIIPGKGKLVSTKNSYEISGLSKGSSYYVRVYSKGKHGLSQSSNVIEAQTRT